MHRSLFVLLAACVLFACAPEENRSGGVGSASSVTGEASHISAVSAVLAGKADFGSAVTAGFKVGFLYSKSAVIQPSDAVTVEATDADADYNYTAGVSGLDSGTTYYFCSFARQNGQDTYGDTQSFTTKDVSSLLETKEAGDVGAAKATLNAKLDLTDVQYENLSYGFLWGNSEAALNTDCKCTEIQENAISAVLTDLTHQTQYWYKAYVQLDGKTLSGSVKNFTTGVVPVESVSLDKNEYAFDDLKATVLPADATDKSVKWSSDKEDVATVDQTGTVTAVSKGKATIKATANDGSGCFASCSVSVGKQYTAVPGEAIDLGLSVKWSSMNLGAVSPSGYGDYFAWGETEPKDAFSWATYEWCDGSASTLTKYNYKSEYGVVDNKKQLKDYDYADDAARQALGGNWRIPTDPEWTELREKCKWKWVTNYKDSGVNGQLGTADNGNSIFLPVAGYRRGDSHYGANSYGYYWSSSICTSSYTARGVEVRSGGVNWLDFDRYYGCSVRPVTE